MSSTAKMPIAMPKSVSAPVDLLRRRAFLDEELRLVHVWEHQPVADEARPVADDDAELPQPLRERQRRRQHVERRSRGPRTISSSRITAAGLKKWRPTTDAGREVTEAIASMSSVDVFVARMQPGFAIAIELAEDLLLQREILEHRLDDQIRAAGARGEARRADRMDARHALGRRRPAVRRPRDTDTS